MVKAIAPPYDMSKIQRELESFLYDRNRFTFSDWDAFTRHDCMAKLFGKHQYDRDWFDPAISDEVLLYLIEKYVDSIKDMRFPKQFSAQLFLCYKEIRIRLNGSAENTTAELIKPGNRPVTPDLNQMQRRLGHQKPALPATPTARLEHRSPRRSWLQRILG